ncbi:glycine--tRNA ligase subunit beta [Allopontixanthobacter sp.]|uniref:glycine--tRNA ligase subunit beta n=1 Tax=Allopontixanthobacter sp. TaxID=2906452 RepID=UPI002ABC0CBA|nr:glycine--tRNA ligase subunit beta [Allopontixanthobacter sp.]MDZ4307343.1 glycine--tRNA ligase subunit beta [Allopontixanthobacter sp.]
MPDFLLELRCEEIPARMQKGARADLEKLFRAEMAAAGVLRQAQDERELDVTVWSTPRRLALIARDLPTQTEAVNEIAKGPPEGAPDQAIDGFCRKNGVTRESLELRDVKGRSTYFAVIEQPGRAVADVLADAIPAIIRAFPWPKSMRWGASSISTESLRWVRPLSGIVAIFGDEVVPCEVDGVTSGCATLGHRFHHPGPITLGGASDYAEKLRACHVIVDHGEREAMIRSGAANAAAIAGLDLVEDEGLVVENAGLTEWPVPLVGRFEEDFLQVPPEVIQLTARVNQKYFVCEKDGKLANAFICTANIEAADGGEAIVDGNRKVLAARLSDARFFWDVDRKKTLAQHAEGLGRITFHEKLGTVADKAERVAKLARWLVVEGIIPPQIGAGDNATLGGGAGAVSATSQGSSSPPVPLHHPAGGPPPPMGEDRARLADQAELAARLCKADLVTEMVGEFPELQGLMGGYYARAEGLPDAVADAIRDHYKPVGQGDDVPTAPVTVAVSLADKLDTLICFFAIGARPSGSKDPFALRRAGLGCIALILENGLRSGLARLVDAWNQLFDPARNGPADLLEQMTDFFADRLKVQQREAGVRHDLIDAVFTLGGEDDLVRLLARVSALQNYVETAEGANLLAAYKRAANILKKEGWITEPTRSPAQAGAQGEGALSPTSPPPARGSEGDDVPHTGEEDPFALVDDPDMKPVIEARMAERHAGQLSYTPEPAEQALIDALAEAEPRAAAAIAAEDFSAAMAALASLRAPIDAFFEEVTVNDPQENKRTARLDLLARFRAAVHNVADFSKIEG